MDKPRPAVTLTRHPPERRQARPVSLCAGCCCCCCCCCLHTLGGILGSAVAPATASPFHDGPPPSLDFDDRPFPATLPRSSRVKRGEEGIATGEDRPRRRRRADDEDVFDLRQPSRVSAVALFWYITLALSVVLVAAFAVGTGRDGGVLVGLFALVMTFPAVQLVSAILTLFFVLFSTRADRAYQLGQVGRITGGLVVGTLFGFLAMVLMCAGCRGIR